MDMQEYFDKVVKEGREESFSNSPQLTIGEIIKKFESINLELNGNHSEDSTKDVNFDFASAVPTNLGSWRGSYSELALGFRLSGYDNDDEHFAKITAIDLLKHLKEAIGKSYYGWKGGDYVMSEDTPVWVANDGNSGSTAIVDVVDNGYNVILMTQYCEY